MEIAYCQAWYETERGWGQRPDGFSLHFCEADCAEYIQKYWANQPLGPAPDEYSAPDGKPYLVKVSKKLYKTLKKNKGSRFFGLYTPAPNSEVDESKL